MRVDVSGTRNGEPWPTKGSTVELPQDEAKNLIAIGLAVEADDEEPGEPAEENAQAPVDEETAAPRKPSPRKPAPKPAK
ncbi:hypothetical protein [Streptomyces sp. NPDC005969]|uniref:hypothetical protein n=1 Tax=Streptomyces sp. NPDC005969 TaxID=3156722 RepID=UPI0033CCB290